MINGAVLYNQYCVDPLTRGNPYPMRVEGDEIHVDVGPVKAPLPPAPTES